eukprot:scaffold23468_cov71-Phaeocystis_antarctica.AAC.3
MNDTAASDVSDLAAMPSMERRQQAQRWELDHQIMMQTHHNEVLEMQARQNEYGEKMQVFLAPKVASGALAAVEAEGHRQDLLTALQAERDKLNWEHQQARNALQQQQQLEEQAQEGNGLEPQARHSVLADDAEDPAASFIRPNDDEVSFGAGHLYTEWPESTAWPGAEETLSVGSLDGGSAILVESDGTASSAVSTSSLVISRLVAEK